MKISSSFTIVAIVTVLSCPTLAFAAEGGEQSGSWLALVFYIINFALFIWVTKRYGGKFITDFFRTRARDIRGNRSRAESAFKEAQELSKRAAELTAGLAAEKERLGAGMAAETSFQVKQIQEAGRESVARIKRDAALGLAAAQDAGQRRLRESLAAAAGRLAQELVRGDFHPADQSRLLADFVGRLHEEAGR